jgi:hypothetical protein
MNEGNSAPENGAPVKPLSICFFSSFVFLTNCITAIFVNDPIYFGVFFTLFITSLIVYSNNNIWTILLDKIPIIAVILYGAYRLSKKFNRTGSSVILATFIAVIFLYCYGYVTDSYCYDPDSEVASQYHSLLHGISSTGHHLIMIL